MSGNALAQSIATQQPAFAEKADAAMHDGEFVNVEGMKLTMTDKEGKQHSHILSASTKLTLDGEACKASDMKPGAKIRVTTDARDPMKITEVECLGKNDEFAVSRHEGKLVSLDGKSVVMTSDSSKGEEKETSSVNYETRYSCDGKPCKWSDLKPGMEVRVTSERNKHKVAAKIEALDENDEFAGILR
jgi:hypothetical protein